MPNNAVVYALDFDGVLVDSAGETAQSGIRGARILWALASWIIPEDDHGKMKSLIERFRVVRPVLYVGWESIVMVKLLLDPDEGCPSNDDILKTFHCELKEKVMQQSGFNEFDYGQAMKVARDSWIAQDHAQDWISAHGFFEGACNAVKDYLQNFGNDNIYVITTKAKDFAERLLEERGLYGKDDLLKASHIFGLGSGEKAQVLKSIVETRTGETIAVMVEDNVATLDKIMTSPIQGQVLPVVAAWGYNTEEQLQDAQEHGYLILNDKDSSSLAEILKDDEVIKHYRQQQH
ncbi:putative phosphatase [Nitzschia inconspicua]|uniref:Phosphatase n=1 Tax=Nitzschia inconspicua TaxID=303405 RepID=A0A9K3L7K2_9STRA|nr:putative phosphatase [Nitzschia inconspicua]